MDTFVKTLHWSRNVTPEAGDYPQNIINKQILDKSDAVIAIFGNKIGSETQHYESGTIEEIERMIQKGKQVFVYFSDKPIRKSERDIKQEKKIQAFKNKYKNKGIYVDYSSDEEFDKSVSRNLMRYLTAERVNSAGSIEEHTRFDDFISQNKAVDMLYDYTRFYKIKPIVSCPDACTLEITPHMDCFDMNIRIHSVEKISSHEFAMALFEYAPCDNWAGFYEAGYSLEFDAISSDEITAFQLEIKDDLRNKIVDKMINVSSKGEHFQIQFSSITRDRTAWRKISQMCFTVFFSKNYLDGKQGTLCIRNLKMEGENEY